MIRLVKMGLLIQRKTEKEINIYVGLSEMQRKWYRSVLEKDLEAVNGEIRHSQILGF